MGQNKRWTISVVRCGDATTVCGAALVRDGRNWGGRQASPAMAEGDGPCAPSSLGPAAGRALRCPRRRRQFAGSRRWLGHKPGPQLTARCGVTSEAEVWTGRVVQTIRRRCRGTQDAVLWSESRCWALMQGDPCARQAPLRTDPNGALVSTHLRCPVTLFRIVDIFPVSAPHSPVSWPSSPSAPRPA